MRLALLILCALLVGCASDPFHRHRDEFPPAVPKDAPDGVYVTRTGFIEAKGGEWRRFDF